MDKFWIISLILSTAHRTSKLPQLDCLIKLMFITEQREREREKEGTDIDFQTQFYGLLEKAELSLRNRQLAAAWVGLISDLIFYVHAIMLSQYMYVCVCVYVCAR